MRITALLFWSCVLTGCAIRAVAVVETEEAVYGKTNIEKEGDRDPNRKDPLSLWESLVGIFNSDSFSARKDADTSPPAVLP